jgi:hypothetical protein
VKGKAYYLEAVMKEGRGGDHLSVAVKLPGRSRPKPISKEDVYVKPPGNGLSQYYISLQATVSVLYVAMLCCIALNSNFVSP